MGRSFYFQKKDPALKAGKTWAEDSKSGAEMGPMNGC